MGLGPRRGRPQPSGCAEGRRCSRRQRSPIASLAGGEGALGAGPDPAAAEKDSLEWTGAGESEGRGPPKERGLGGRRRTLGMNGGGAGIGVSFAGTDGSWQGGLSACRSRGLGRGLLGPALSTGFRGSRVRGLGTKPGFFGRSRVAGTGLRDGWSMGSGPSRRGAGETGGGRGRIWGVRWGCGSRRPSWLSTPLASLGLSLRPPGLSLCHWLLFPAPGPARKWFSLAQQEEFLEGEVTSSSCPR